VHVFPDSGGSLASGISSHPLVDCTLASRIPTRVAMVEHLPSGGFWSVHVKFVVWRR